MILNFIHYSHIKIFLFNNLKTLQTTSVQIENYLELSSSQQQFLLKVLQQKLTIIHPNVTKLVVSLKFLFLKSAI